MTATTRPGAGGAAGAGADGARDGARRPGGPASAQVEAALAELGRIHLDEVPLQQVMHRVAELTRACLPGAVEASVTVLDGGRASTIASTSPVATRLDERQYERGTGPCVDAAASGSTITLFRLDRERHYADFAAVAWGSGLEGSASIGMPARGRTGGALNLYDFSGAGLDEAAVHLAQVFASYAAVALASAALAPGGLAGRAGSGADGERGVLPTGTARDTVERAKGVLIARLACSPEDAAVFLAEQARATCEDLAAAAAGIVRAAQRRVPH